MCKSMLHKIVCTHCSFLNNHLCRIHITAAPLFGIMTILHYNKAILYFSPSILYYASTTIPNYVQSWMQRRANGKGTRILSITKIPCLTNQKSTATVWDIVFECSYEAFEQYQQGQYCNMYVPQISIVAHPFTVNKVPGYTDRLRLLVRETGTFTTQLGKCFHGSLQRSAHAAIDETAVHSLSAASLPSMHISGFYGMHDRKELIRSHDHAIMIAGGIGITPYLTGLLELTSKNLSTSSSSSSCLKVLELHWVCRDSSLIRYIYDEYFSKILKCSSLINGVSLKIIVHYTGTEEDIIDCKSLLTRCIPEPSSEYRAITHPTEQSYFSLSKNSNKFQDKVALMAFTGIFTFGLWIIWFFCVGVQNQDAIITWTRVNSVFFVAALSIGSSVGLTHFANASKAKSKELSRSLSSQKMRSDYSSTTADNSCNFSSYVQHNYSGRPKFTDLLLPLQDIANNVGVFVCGPESMLKSIRDAVDCMPDPLPVYEERFEQ